MESVLGQFSESKFLLLQLSYAQTDGRTGIERNLKQKHRGQR